MRQSVQQVTRRQTSAVNKKRYSVTHLRPRVVSQSNHTGLANDKWERQADEAAARHVCGEVDIARMLTPVPAASKKVASSRAQPLPRKIKEELEYGFGADLTAVRIHLDAGASAEARFKQARAFTSGSDIYFSEASIFRDIELLAHEIAHVLQQTGRKSSDGVIRATTIQGPNEIQYKKDEFVDNADSYGLFTGPQIWAEIKKEYQGVTDYAVHEAIISAYIPPTLPIGPTELEGLIAETKKVSFNGLSDSLKAFYVDALKLVSGYERARIILVANLNLPTAFRSRLFYEYVRNKSLGWMYRTAARHPFIKDFYPWRFIECYRQFFIDIGSEPLDLDPAAGASGTNSFENKLCEQLANERETKGLKSNELQVTMLLAMFYLDTARRQFLPKEIAAYRGERGSMIRAYKQLAESYAEATAAKHSPSGTAESKALFAAVYSEIQKHAAKAAKYWNRILEFKRAHKYKKGFKALDAEEVKALAEGIKTDTLFANFPNVFYRTAKNVLRPKKPLYSPSDFAKQVEQTRQEIRNEIAKYVPVLSKLIKAGKDADPEGLRIGLAIAYLSDVDIVLARYGKGLDMAMSQKKMSDVRLATRLRLAHVLLDIAIVFAWDKTRGLANGVFLEGLQLALLTVWEQDQEHEFGQMAKELSPELASYEGTKISGALIDRFHYIQFFEKLTEQLTDKMIARSGDYSDKTPVLTEAMAEAKKQIKRPRRYIVREWEVGSEAFASGDVAFMVKSFLQVIFDHPKTKALLKREQKNKEMAIAPAKVYRSEQPLFLWIAPRFDEFIAKVAEPKIVREALSTYWKLTYGKDQSPPDPVTSPFAWFKALAALVLDVQMSGDAAKKAKLKAIGDAISGAVETKFRLAETTAHAKAREAVSHERRVLVENRLRTLLKSYDRFDNRYWNLPDKIFAIIRNFGAFVWPESDQALQTCAMTLEIADELMEAFGPKEVTFGTSHIRRFDIVDTVLILAWGAVTTWKQGVPATKAVAAGKASVLNPVTTISWLTQQELERRVTVLETLRDSLGKQAVAEQLRHGLMVSKSEKAIRSIYWEKEGWALIKWNMTHTMLKEGQGFSLYGSTYLIVSVDNDFTFHPGFGRRESLGIDWGSGKRPGDARIVDKSGNEVVPSGRPLFKVLHTPRFGDPELYTVTDKDFVRLTWFSKIVSEHFGFKYIQGAGLFLEKYANLLMDVLEFLPGVGRAVAAARFTAEILHTISQPEFSDLLDAFSEDGFGAFETIISSLSNVVDPDELVDVLLFDADFKETTYGNKSLRGKQARQKAVSSRGGPWVRIARMLKNVIEIGVRILHRLKRLAKRVQTPVREAQLWVLRTPAAILILGLIERGFDVLSTLSVDELAESAEELMDKGWQQMIKEASEKSAQGVVDRGRDALDTLRNLELPEEVIPVEWIIDFIIDLAVHALRAKYRKGAEAVRAVLRKLGLWNKILTKIKKRLYVEGVDPNELYRKHVRDKLQPWLSGVRDDFAAELTLLINEVPLLKAITKPKGTPIQLGFSGLGFPEAEAYGVTEQAVEPAAQQGWFGSSAAGQRLSSPLRLREEAALGHDFSHVRLHHGSEGDRVTRLYSAEAITSGSHVYMRSGLNQVQAQGQKVLRHELAHVLQQTGPRPLGGNYSDVPQRGQPNKGLVRDESREAEADAATRIGGSRNLPSRPFRVEGAASGIQPIFSREFLRKFLRRLQSEADIAEAREEIEKVQKKKVPLSAEHQAVADKIAPAIKKRLAKKSTFSQPFSEVHDELKLFINAVWPDFEKSVPALVELALTTMAPPKRTKKERKIVSYLPAANLKMQLQRLLYGMTSMAIVIELNETKGPKTVKGRDIVDKKNPIKWVDVVYVHLPLLEEGTNSEKLWDLLTKNTFQHTLDYSNASHNSFKTALKLVLGRGSPAPGTYLKSGFKLSSRRAKVVRDMRDRLLKFVPATIPWPDKAEYIATDASVVRKGVQDLGLRLGTYATWGPSAKSGNDRDAHHTVQYLLFEYFRNEKGRKPFPLLGTKSAGLTLSYPGVTPTAAKNTVASIGGKIDIDTYFPGRGGAMTTVYLARHTHQSGIHYKSEPPDDGASPRPTQGASIDNTFKAGLGRYKSAMGDITIMTQLTQLEKDGKPNEPIGSHSRPITVNRVKKEIIRASQSTYKDMWGDMKKKLKKALSAQEVKYYNEIAKLRGSSTRLQASDMTSPFNTIVARTEAEIGTKSGFGS